MLKSAIVATTAIASLLSITSIVHAHDRASNLTTNFSQVSRADVMPSIQPRISLIAGEQEHQFTNNDAGVQTEIQSIHQAISQHYREWNERLAPSGQSWSGACSFFEVKSLKLVSLSDTSAQLEAEVESQSYSLLGIHVKPRQWAFQKMEESRRSSKSAVKINLEKSKGKWKVRSTS
jgi:hypothetical protein